MRFVAAVLFALAIGGAAMALHPPIEQPGSTSTSTSTGTGTTTGGGSTSVGSTTGGTGPHITDLAPEPTAVTLAVLGVLGGGGYRLVRRRK